MNAGRAGRSVAHRLRGTRAAGVTVLLTSSVGHAGNYLYYVVAARMLGPESFAEVTAVTALGTMLLLPFTGIQNVVARDISEHDARGDGRRVMEAVRWTVVRMLTVQTVLFALLAAAAPLATRVLSLPLWVWLVGATWLASGVLLQVLIGPLQGLGRFLAVGVVLGGPMGLLRLLLLIPLAAVAGSSGALSALTIATVIGAVGVLWVLRPQLGHPAPETALRSGPASPQLSNLGVTIGALLAVGCLTNLDVVAAKILLTPAEAGVYASASLLGRIAFHAPSALAFVLLPAVTRQVVAGGDIARPMLVTAAAVLSTGLATLGMILLAPASIMTSIFGSGFATAYDLAAPLAAISTVSALLYMQLMLAFARRNRTLPVLLMGAGLASVPLLGLLGDQPSGIVVSMAIVVGSAFLAHEIVSRDGLVRLGLRARRLNAGHEPVQAAGLGER